MIVTNIRYGESQVQRIYLNDKIIWNKFEYTPIALNSVSELNSYTNCQMYSLVLTLMNGTSENTTDANAIGRVLEIDMMCGQGESISDTDSIANILNVLSMKNSAESKMYIVNNFNVLDADVMKSYVISKIEDKNTMRTFEFLAMLPDYIFTKSNDFSVANVKHTILASVFIENNSFNRAVAGCLKLLGVYSNLELNSYSNAKSQISDMLLVNSDVENSSSNASGIGRLFEILLLHGCIALTSDENAILDAIDVCTFSGDGNSESYTLSISKILQMLNINSDGKNETSTNSTMILLYPPIEDGDVLEIRQAYNVVIKNDILEVS